MNRPRIRPPLMFPMGDWPDDGRHNFIKITQSEHHRAVAHNGFFPRGCGNAACPMAQGAQA